tara:strand:+ start:1015 stop:1251 length:237 start_codon:yes stop_codon:yes gene_type:complete
MRTKVTIGKDGRHYTRHKGRVHRVGLVYPDGTALLNSVTVMGAGTGRVSLNDCYPVKQEDADALADVEPHLLTRHNTR